MKSLDKVKPFTKQLSNWLGKYNGPFLVSEKLDGLSGLLVIQYQKGNDHLTTHLYKRGDGTRGQEVSHLIKYIQTKPYGNRKIDKLSTLNKDTQTYLKKKQVSIFLQTNHKHHKFHSKQKIMEKKHVFSSKS